MYFLLLFRRPPQSTHTDTLLPYTTLFRSIRALLAGTGDVTFPGPFSLFSAANEGAKITAIGSWQGVADYNFIVNSGIKSMKDLEGKIFAGDRKSTRLNSSH